MKWIKQNKINHKKSFVQFFRFCIVGVSNILIDLGIYYLIVWMNGYYLLANSIAWIISVLNAFYWNHKYVFKTTNAWFKELVKTYFSYGLSFVLSNLLLWIYVDCIGISKMFAPLLVLPITTPINFILNKFWVYRLH